MIVSPPHVAVGQPGRRVAVEEKHKYSPDIALGASGARPGGSSSGLPVGPGDRVLRLAAAGAGCVDQVNSGLLRNLEIRQR